MPSKLFKIPLAPTFFFLGLFTVTWDYFLSFDLGGFTLKIYQLFFLISFLLSVWRDRSDPDTLAYFRKKAPRGFPIAMALLATYYLVTSPFSYFPLKSLLYSGWLFFDLVVIWANTILLSRHLKKESFVTFVSISVTAQSVIILIDHIAYQFGYIDGLIGFNQDSVLKWGASRPHAFASEPSYIATFIYLGLILNLASTSKLWVKKALTFFTIAIGTFAVLVAASRTGWFGLIAGLSLFWLLNASKNWRRAIRRAGAFVTLVIMATALIFVSTPSAQRKILNESLITSIYHLKDGSGSERLRSFGYAWEMFLETNGLGTGLGASYKYWTATRDTRYTTTATEFNSSSYGREVVLSTWGQLLAEGGLTAVILYLLAGLSLVRLSWRNWRDSGDPIPCAAFVACSIYFGFTAFWLGNVARGDLWIWFALWSALILPSDHSTSQKIGNINTDRPKG